MFEMIGGVLKYTALVITILVLSHIIQIKGVSITDHVGHALDYVSGAPSRVSHSISEIKPFVDAHTAQLNRAAASTDADMATTEQRQLDHVIQQSQQVKH
jgi:hypothetical protein